MAFALYSLTTFQLTGYDLETGAVAEGLVLEGHLADDESSPLPLKADIPGHGRPVLRADRPPAAAG